MSLDTQNQGYPVPAYGPGHVFGTPPKPKLDTRTPEQRVLDDAAHIVARINYALNKPRGKGYDGQPVTLKKIWDVSGLDVECDTRGGIGQPEYFDLKSITLDVSFIADLMPGSTAVEAVDALIDRAGEWVEALREMRGTL
jgi:hypothetical protein